MMFFQISPSSLTMKNKKIQRKIGMSSFKI